MKTRTLIQIIMVLVVAIGILIPNESFAMTKNGRFSFDGTKIVSFKGTKMEVLKEMESTKAKYRNSRRVKAIWLSFTQDGHAKCEMSISKNAVHKLTEAVEIRTTQKEFKKHEFGLRKQGWKIRKSYVRNYGRHETNGLFVNMYRETYY